MKRPAVLTEFGWHELSVLLLLCIFAGATWAFIEIADEISEGGFRDIDTAILLALRSPTNPADPLGPRWFEESVRDVTALGGTVVTLFITLAASGFLMLQGKRRAALFIVVAVASGAIVSAALKSGFDRPRPDLVPHGSFVYSSSFPSGHAMTAGIVYMTLAAVLIRVQTRRRLRVYLASLAVVLTIVIGTSRVYLGVHWPSDVIGGWAAGAAWAVLWWTIALWLQRRGDVEKGPDSDP
jgi:undecaprenyl-diphosphatase